ncbi:TldD/PmbA family protein [Falsigemmobacter intermedius]|uniref:TldD/PmbA family protein n=1 Tax=Falsigemmobacter intermedius TaxID=1553448 RepID=A0A3S4Y1D3_9RHOB|nr:TldD/PmbA family protein [Falsigemmobacter intermedius]RWY45562.1 TldD/PmbA family protein [Falsigemmobacter intermedius]
MSGNRFDPATLEGLTARLLDAARKAGAESADAVAVAGDAISIDVRGGKLEQAERAEGFDIGLRVLIGRRQASVSASDISDDVIAGMAERAVAMAREAPEDPTAGLADPSQLARSWDQAALEMIDPAAAPTAAELQEDALRTEAAARDVAGISQVDSSSASYSRRAFHMAATNGFSGGYGRTGRAISCVAITGTGSAMERDFAGESRAWAADLPSPESIGLLAAERALARAGAKRPPTGRYPVLFDERISGSLIGHLLSAINGSSIARGSSFLRDKLGRQVLPKGLDLIEDPTRPRISGSRPFDGEGLPTQRRAFVRDGVLESWILDLATARKLGMESTANAARGTGGPPGPSAGNITLTEGTASREDLIRQMGTGLLVTSMIGSTINPTTGDYSRGAAGYWVENGKIVGAVNECTIAGNLIDMLGRITPANDARRHLSAVVPSLLVEGMTLAGA